MSMCFGRYGSEAECCFCAEKYCCMAETKKKLGRWRYACDHPRPEVSTSEHEIALNEAGLKRWAERDKVKEALGK